MDSLDLSNEVNSNFLIQQNNTVELEPNNQFPFPLDYSNIFLVQAYEEEIKNLETIINDSDEINNLKDYNNTNKVFESKKILLNINPPPNTRSSINLLNTSMILYNKDKYIKKNTI